METTVEKSCWGVTFWTVAIAVAVAALVSLASSVDVVENDTAPLNEKPASLASTG